MTVISGIEIGHIKYIPNDIHNAIKNNECIEDKLHLIICVSNPCQYARRFILAKEFINRIHNNHRDDVLLYVVELVYNLPNMPKQEFHVTDPNNKRHLQLRTDTAPLWHKENMLNIAVKKLLPDNWKAVAFCDSDIEFDNPHFATDTLKILNGTRDIVHMHSHALDLDLKLNPMSIFSSFGYQYTNNRTYTRNGIHYFHPGYNVAMTRETFDKLGGLYDYGILGSGDQNMFFCLMQNGLNSVNKDVSNTYKMSVLEYQERCKGLRLGYIPGVIRHYFHGAKKNRQYSERWKILVNHQYNPYIHVKYDEQGLLVPTENCPKELLVDIYVYFSERNEDEGVLEAMENMKLK